MATEAPSVRLRWAAPLVASCLAGLIWLARARLVGPRLDFLWWNLLLAWIPWLLSAVLVRTRGAWSWPLGAAWLVFLPNAPYLVTDLLHFKERAPVPLWFDLLLWVSFALAGLLLGWTSLEAVARSLADRLGRAGSSVFVVSVLLLTGFGTYLGRFLRLNSWDVVVDPLAVFTSALHALAKPHAVFFSAAFAALVGAGYLLVGPAREDG
ncbi:MAG: DUF1361 domain-containing protein [Myxococcota bacterium]